MTIWDWDKDVFFLSEVTRIALALLEAIARCDIPRIRGIGHELDAWCDEAQKQRGDKV